MVTQRLAQVCSHVATAVRGGMAGGLFSSLPRRLGRYPIILLSLLGFLIFGFGTAFVSSFYQYLFFRFFVAQASVGYAICSVSLGDWLSRGRDGTETDTVQEGTGGRSTWEGQPNRNLRGGNRPPSSVARE